MSKRVAVYGRVSTTRQAENDISIPDQLAHAERYCRAKGWIVLSKFVDPGASARDDKRPQFQRMMELACVDPSPFDVILVHSQSRFFRDTAGYVVSKRKLAKHGVSLVSITQDFGEGAAAEFAETVIAASDALNSAETSKHVTRTMLENARQGFWNGSMPPFGYRTVEAERRGQRIKKRLEIDPKAAETVRLIFKLFLKGDGQSGPMGVKAIAAWLNGHGLTNGQAKQFYTGMVHAILTRHTYQGVHYYNKRDSRTFKPRAQQDWVAVSVPAIVSESDFQQVQACLRQRRPSITAPRIVNSNVLLTGIVRCESCGGAMMIRTGKGGRYRYYACSGNRLRGRAACCDPIAVPEGQLNGLVLNALADHLLSPERLPALLREALKQRKSLTSGNVHRRSELRRQLKDTDGKIRRLYEALAAGTVSDTTLFRDTLRALESHRDESIRLAGLLDVDAPPIRRALSKAQAQDMGTKLKSGLLGAQPDIQRRYVRGLVSDICVSRKSAVICGPKDALASAISAGAFDSSVRSFVREWRARKDSNLRPPDS